jgi:hypothetical protein
MSNVRLRDLFPLRDSVQLTDNASVEIFPLQLPDIVRLIGKYGDAFVALFNASQQENPNYEGFAVTVPELVTDIICIGAPELADQREDVALLPPGPKLQLLARIWGLSVPDPKKLIESLSSLMEQAKRLAKEARERMVSQNGSEGSPTPGGSTSSSANS